MKVSTVISSLRHAARVLKNYEAAWDGHHEPGSVVNWYGLPYLNPVNDALPAHPLPTRLEPPPSPHLELPRRAREPGNQPRLIEGLPDAL